MDQLQKLFKSLSIGQRIGIAMVVLMSIGGVTSFVRWRHESDFRPLFTNMPPEDASAIIQKLKEAGAEYRLSENGTTVLAPAAKVDELRLEMAGLGLPKSGRIGFELFDKTNLGITDFSEHVNYGRALEGELERSVRSLSEVEQARVHITLPKESVFLDSREPAKASVLISLRTGARLSDANVLAITNLVAGAVEGLGPEFVSVVDGSGNLLSRPKRAGADSSDSSDAALGYKHQVEKDLLSKIELTLIPLLGEEHFRVGISADCDFSTSEQTDESYDPTRSVMTNSQKSEDLANKPDSAGVPGTSSNTPRPISRPSMGASNVSRKTENVAYETSRSVRQVKTPRGTVKRLSASILLDQETHWEGTGSKAKRTQAPLSAEKIKAIHDVVAGIIGLTPARGDQLIVESLPFEQKSLETSSQLPVKPETDADLYRKLLKSPKAMIGAGAVALLVIGALLFALTRKKITSAVVGDTPQLDTPAAGQKTGSDARAKPGELDKAHAAAPHVAAPYVLPAPTMPEGLEQIEAIRATMKANVNRDPILAANVLRSWIAGESGG